MTATNASTNAGHLFARLVKAAAIGRGDWLQAEAFAAAKGWDAVARVCRAVVNPLDQNELDNAMHVVNHDLATLLRPQTIVGRLQGLRRVPFRTRVLRQTIGGSGAWVEEGKPIPVSAAGFEDTESLDQLKVGSIIVLTMELMRNLTVGADALVAADLAASLVQALDEAFIDPANNGIAGRKPASITSGATQLNSSGSSITAIDSDLEEMVQVLVAAEMPLTTAAWILSPITATHLALKRGSSGSPAYPGMTVRGGILAGLPAITSTVCEAGGSPNERSITLIEAGEVLLADDNEAAVDVSSKASLQMNDAPAAGDQQLVSLWQNSMTGIKTTRTINWSRRRDGCAVVLRNVTY